MISSFANSVITLTLVAFGSHHPIENGPLMMFRDSRDMWNNRGDSLGRHYTPGDYLKYQKELWRMIFGREIFLRHSRHQPFESDERNERNGLRDSMSRFGSDSDADYIDSRLTPNEQNSHGRLGQGGSANINPGGLPFQFDYEYRLQNYDVSTCITGNMWADYVDSATLMTRCTCQLDCNYLIHYSRDATVWKVIRATGYREGTFKLKNKQTGKCLTFGMDGGTSVTQGHNNVSFKQLPCQDYAKAQAFKIGERYTSNPLSVAKNAVAIESLLGNMEAAYDDLSPLVITGGSFEGDSSVWSATFWKGQNQFWYFKQA